MATIYSSPFPHCSSIISTTRRSVNKTDISLLPAAASHFTRRDFPRTRVAVSLPAGNITNADYLETEFSGRAHGVTFTQISDSCVVRMALQSGSVANILLPSGLITSYKAEMWHGGVVEILHTSVSQGEEEEEEDGSAVIRGGVSVAVDCYNDQGLSWSPKTWAFHQLKGSPKEDFIQVELMSKNTEANVEIKHIVTLKQYCLKSEINIFNHNTLPLRMSGSVLGHLTVSTPEATYAVGLQHSDFINRPPFSTDYGIIPPGFGKRKNQTSNNFWDPAGIVGIFSRSRTRNAAEKAEGESEDEIEGEETDNYKCLTDEMSKIYRHAPRDITIIDRGRRNSVIVGREGFKEVYMLSPGSRHDSYGKYAYICIGQAAVLEPIVVESQGEWRGVHRLHNPNT
nr:protein NDH-DEPENDENT CYCLIC ELECTRON FLOW 5 [Ipomoea batatas]